MPAVSEKQRKFMALVHAVQQGRTKKRKVSAKVKAAAGSMTQKQSADFMHLKKSGTEVLLWRTAAGDPDVPLSLKAVVAGMPWSVRLASLRHPIQAKRQSDALQRLYSQYVLPAVSTGSAWMAGVPVVPAKPTVSVASILKQFLGESPKA